MDTALSMENDGLVTKACPKPRVLIINTKTDLPEANLYFGLMKQGIDLELWCEPGETRLDLLQNAGIPVRFAELRTRFHSDFIQRLRAHHQAREFDLVYAPTGKALSNVILALGSTKVKILSYRGTMGNLSPWNPASRMSHLNSRVDGIVCIADAVKESLIDLGVAAHKLHTIHRGHSPKWYEPVESADLAAFGLPQNAFVVGMFANIRPLKGLDVLIRSLTHIPRDRNVHVLVAGKIRDRNVISLTKKLTVEDRVHFIGFQREPLPILKACHATALPSLRREGLPRALLESMCLAVVPVVSDVGGMKEVVSDGESGFVVPKGDDKALATRLKQLSADPDLAIHMGQRAREHLNERASNERYVQQMSALFDKLVHGEDRMNVTDI